MKPVKLMAHIVAGYPSLDHSRRAARGLADGGADFLEVQFPFSDPSADGPLIERACQTALDNGFRVDDGFALMRTLRQDLSIPLFIMTYGSLVFARGAAEFCRQTADAGLQGLIVPDLPPDYAEGLFEEGAKAGLAVVPVIAPEIRPERLRLIRDCQPKYIYTALRLGITGSRTVLDDDTIRYLDRIKELGAEVIAGFGVRSREQMQALAGHADAAAVGSHFLEQINAAGPEADIAAVLSAAVRELKG
ncbi:MAG: tryptophan synthase subunit alpha [Planctomycetes bacterium]|nr:tryptophan synthase subunit alpha [Planctomycetota bacterium]